MVKGVRISDEELNKMTLYYMFGDAFGWTPSEVDEIDNYTIQGLAHIHQAVAKEQEEVMNRARRR